MVDRRLWIARVVVLGLAGAILAGLWFLWESGFFDGGGWLWPVLGGMFLLGLLPLVGMLFRRRNKGILVLWCRRFSTPNQAVGNRNRWIWAVITEACQGVAIPVTIRDRSLVGSQSVGRSLQNPLSILLIILGTPLWLWAMLWVLGFVDGSLPEFLVCAVGLVGYVFMFKVIGDLVVMVTATMATHHGDPAVISRRLRRIKQSQTNRRELEALRCTDDTWQDCVLAVLGEADFVIIDNADSSGNIDWEIQRSIERVGGERVFMLLRPGALVPPEVTPIVVDFDSVEAEISQLQAAWGDDDFGETVTLGSEGKKLAATLREKLAVESPRQSTRCQ